MSGILLDLGGEYFRGTSLPTFSNGLNANEYLYNLQQRFKLFTENRLLVTNLIERIGGDLPLVPWYKEIDYVTYLNDLEHSNFVGTVKERYTQAREAELTKSLRLSIVGDCEAGIYLGVKEEYQDFAIDVAHCLSVFETNGIKLPKIHVVIPCASSDRYVERTLYRELSDSGDKIVLVNVIFVLKDNTQFTDSMNSNTGMLCMLNWVVNSLECMIERKMENGIFSEDL
jgi:hypothetical protein